MVDELNVDRMIENGIKFLEEAIKIYCNKEGKAFSDYLNIDLNRIDEITKVAINELFESMDGSKTGSEIIAKFRETFKDDEEYFLAMFQYIVASIVIEYDKMNIYF